MLVTNLTDFRKNLKSYFEKVFDMKAPLIISRARGEDMVLLSKSEFDSIQETFYLLKSPKNAERLMAAIEEDKKGNGVSYKLVEE